MAEIFNKYFNPRVLNRVAALELKARQVVEGIVTGLHKSPYHGISVEFAEHREYVQGDEIKHIDWRVYARSDRFFIKQYEEETNMRCYVLLDTSESMLYGSRRASKLEYGSLLAASISYLLLQQRDSCGLVTFDDNVKSYLPPRNNPKHFRLILRELELAKPGLKTDISAVFHDLAERIKKRGLVIIISDFFSDIEKTLLGLAHLKHKKHEVIVFHILDRAEITFPFQEMTLFKGLEEKGDILAEAWALREGYLANFKKFEEEMKKGCREKRIDYVQMLTDEPMDLKLSKYLTTRTGRRR
ncbi:MAG: DUF58 domain-containing protein [Candidatus Firestonebacteria bacterium]